MAKKPRLKVLYLQTFPFYGSGSGTYARYLAKEMSKYATTAILVPDERKLNSVKIYTLKMPFKVAFTGHPEWNNCKLYRDLTNVELKKIHKSFLDQTVSAVEDFKPHILHVHHAFPLSWAARFIESTYKIPYIVTIHGSELPTAQKDKRYVDLTTDALEKAKRLIPNSNYTKEWMLKVFKDNYGRKIRVIPGGVDIDKFKKVSTGDIDKKYDLKGKKAVVFAGKLTPYKGVNYLVKAAKKIHGEVLILGHGSEMNSLKQIVKDNDIKNVRFIGHLGGNTDLLVKFYSRADVFVAPSIWDEPLGLVILEAMACETPVVVTRKGGIPLAVKEWRNGLFIKSKRIGDIVEKVNYLLDNDDKRIKMGKTAREITVERFSWEKIGLKFLHIYQKCANFKAPSK